MTEGLKIDVIHECKYFVSGLFIGIVFLVFVFFQNTQRRDSTAQSNF